MEDRQLPQRHPLLTIPIPTPTPIPIPIVIVRRREEVDGEEAGLGGRVGRREDRRHATGLGWFGLWGVEMEGKG